MNIPFYNTFKEVFIFLLYYEIFSFPKVLTIVHPTLGFTVFLYVMEFYTVSCLFDIFLSLLSRYLFPKYISNSLTYVISIIQWFLEESLLVSLWCDNRHFRDLISSNRFWCIFLWYSMNMLLFIDILIKL